MIVILCGVSGAGKTTVGRLLAKALSLPFHDADDFHSAASIGKMTSGLPLNEADRRPWLECLADHLADCERAGGAVLACSALRQSHRAMLSSRLVRPAIWIMLDADQTVLADRLATRKDHFFEPVLLKSQLEALEPLRGGWIIDACRSPEDIVEGLLRRLQG